MRDISRHHAVRAGMHFPFYAFREKLFGGLPSDKAPREMNEMAEYYLAAVPPELKEVFVNPTYTLEDIVSAYLRGEAEGRHGTWFNEQLHKAFWGLPDYVYHWFRLGQIAIAALRDTGRNTAAWKEGLEALHQACYSAGLSESEEVDLMKQYALIFEEIRHRRDVHPLLCSGAIFASLSKTAVAHDKFSQGGSQHMKLLALIVLMLCGFGGFYLLPSQKAVMWLGFIIVAIPPILAVLFESSKLSGANVVELYKLGLRGIPLVGKLIAK